jgi:hypothetical protein
LISHPPLLSSILQPFQQLWQLNFLFGNDPGKGCNIQLASREILMATKKKAKRRR